MRLCPWSLALDSSIPVLGLESVCPRKGCPWPWHRIFLCPWPRALCPRLHLCSVTTGRRAMIYSSNLRKHHVLICAENKVFYIFNTNKIKAEKQKIWLFLVNLLENSPNVSAVI